MTLHEPATFLTDLLLAAFATWLAWRLRRVTPGENRAAWWCAAALALTAASALIGGLYHGLGPNFSADLRAAWWRLTLLSVNGVSAAMALSLVHEVAPPAKCKIWVVVVGVKLATFAAIALSRPVFLVAIVDYGSTMLAWLVAALVLRRAWRAPLLAALALSAVAATVQQLKWAPASRFNHNDLYHVIQMAALAAFFRAARHFGRETVT